MLILNEIARGSGVNYNDGRAGVD